MNKKQRELIFNKFGGKCAYCGVELVKGWHVDELLPCRRKYKIVQAHYLNDKGEFIKMNELPDNCDYQKLKWVDTKDNVFDGYEHPERLHIDNQMPSCPSCNINKHSMSLEDFRNLISGFMKHLNEINTQYKIAKRYGLVEENIKPVKFYFEKVMEII